MIFLFGIASGVDASVDAGIDADVAAGVDVGVGADVGVRHGGGDLPLATGYLWVACLSLARRIS